MGINGYSQVGFNSASTMTSALTAVKTQPDPKPTEGTASVAKGNIFDGYIPSSKSNFFTSSATPPMSTEGRGKVAVNNVFENYFNTKPSGKAGDTEVNGSLAQKAVDTEVSGNIASKVPATEVSGVFAHKDGGLFC